MNLLEQLTARYAELSRCVDAGDAQGAARLYTPAAKLMPQGLPTFSGTAEIAGFFATAFQEGVAALKFTVLEVHEDSESALTNSRFEMFVRSPDGAALVLGDAGRNQVLWRKEAGLWKLHRDMFNREAESK